MGHYLFLTGASVMPGSGDVPFVICTPRKDDKFLNGGLDFFIKEDDKILTRWKKFSKVLTKNEPFGFIFQRVLTQRVRIPVIFSVGEGGAVKKWNIP